MGNESISLDMLENSKLSCKTLLAQVDDVTFFNGKEKDLWTLERNRKKEERAEKRQIEKQTDKRGRRTCSDRHEIRVISLFVKSLVSTRIPKKHMKQRT